ncbi:hypothetical protein RchiOBHm_Chr6g0303871 [Rosa chinensis]|uniref:Uncharacterized protein n=1 Tax=Rosa chinensis TaxID=74649 RepID=A0A2P6PZC7_ROSCH|nr:hypothetical protein RchiOBHm_Chr6g0303871 [Rosa chinensis]
MATILSLLSLAPSSQVKSMQHFDLSQSVISFSLTRSSKTVPFASPQFLKGYDSMRERESDRYQTS